MIVDEMIASLFADLVEKYSDIGLKPCETKKWQRWRHANTAETARRLEFYYNHFPELINFRALFILRETL